ncbi:tRNA dihydrouridine synthase DusB [Saccharospirillum mangrovi]
MAGVTDRPFRTLCRELGAGLVVSEMVTSDTRLWDTAKSRQRLDHDGEAGPISVQIAGGDAQMMAEAARANVAGGAQIIDINMGCPAKKVCNKAAGSALMRDEPLVREILEAVVAAVDVPVTLKTRTGWAPDQRNAVRIARMAEDIGIQALAVHGRTRADAYRGDAEYDTIAAVKAAVSIPVLANGDIDGPLKAAEVLRYTGADGVMIGRAAQGNPWIFAAINDYLATGELRPAPELNVVAQTLHDHVQELHRFYGDYLGARIARKHVGWYLKDQQVDRPTLKAFNALEQPTAQLQWLNQLFDRLISLKETAA